jgi:hypothetical protein
MRQKMKAVCKKHKTEVNFEALGSKITYAEYKNIVFKLCGSEGLTKCKMWLYFYGSDKNISDLLVIDSNSSVKHIFTVYPITLLA